MAHRLAPQAESDLDDIWYYTAEQSQNIEIADRLADFITDRFLLLSAHPHLGRRRDEDLGPRLRSFPAGGFVIIYRVEGQDVLVLRVLRGSRDIEALFRD